MEHVEQDAVVAAYKDGSIRGVVCPYAGQPSDGALFGHTHNFETAKHVDWNKVLTSFASMSFAMNDQPPPWLGVLAQPSQREPASEHIRCRQQVCRGEVLGFLFGDVMPAAHAEDRLRACSTPEQALELAGRMHTFTATPAPSDNSSAQCRDQQAPTPPDMLTLTVNCDVTANPLAQMLETIDEPNAAILMVSNYPAGLIYFPVTAQRDIAAGEIITYKKSEPSHMVVIRALMGASMSALAPKSAAATSGSADATAAEGPVLYRAQPAGVTEAAGAGAKGSAVSNDLLAEVASAACSSMQEIQYMLDAAVATCEGQQQQEGQEKLPDAAQPLGRRLAHANELIQQAVKLLSADSPPAAAAALPPGVLHPETLDTGAALQNAAGSEIAAAADGAAAAAKSAEAAQDAATAAGDAAEVAAAGKGPQGVAPSSSAVDTGELEPEASAGPGGAAAAMGTAEGGTRARLPSPRALSIPVAPWSVTTAPQQQQQQPPQQPSSSDAGAQKLGKAAAVAPPAARGTKKQSKHIASTQQQSGNNDAKAHAPGTAAARASRKRSNTTASRQQRQPTGSDAVARGSSPATEPAPAAAVVQQHITGLPKQQQQPSSTDAETEAPDAAAVLELPAAKASRPGLDAAAAPQRQDQQQPSSSDSEAKVLDAAAGAEVTAAAAAPEAAASGRQAGATAAPQNMQPTGTDVAEAPDMAATPAAEPAAAVPAARVSTRRVNNKASPHDQQQQPSSTHDAARVFGKAAELAAVEAAEPVAAPPLSCPPAKAAAPVARPSRRRPGTTALPQQQQPSSSDAEARATSTVTVATPPAGVASGQLPDTTASAQQQEQQQQQQLTSADEAKASGTAAEPLSSSSAALLPAKAPRKRTNAPALQQQQPLQAGSSAAEAEPDATAAAVAQSAAEGDVMGPDTTALPPQQPQRQEPSSSKVEAKAPSTAAAARAVAQPPETASRKRPRCAASSQQQPSSTDAGTRAPASATVKAEPAAVAAALPTAKAMRKRPAAHRAVTPGLRAETLAAASAAGDIDTSAAAGSNQEQPSKHRRLVVEQPDQPGHEQCRSKTRQQQRRSASVEPASPTSQRAPAAAPVAAGIKPSAVLAASRLAPSKHQLGPAILAEIQGHLEQLRTSLACSSNNTNQQVQQSAAITLAVTQLRVYAERSNRYRRAIGAAGASLLMQLLSSSAIAEVQNQAAAALAVLLVKQGYASTFQKGIPRLVELLVIADSPQPPDSSEEPAVAEQTTQQVATILHKLLNTAPVAHVIASAGGTSKLLQLLDRVLKDLEGGSSSSSSSSSGGRSLRNSNVWDVGSNSSSISSKLQLLDPVLGSLRHMAYPPPDEITRAICAAGGIDLFTRAVIGSTTAVMQLAAQQQQQQRGASSAAAAAGPDLHSGVLKQLQQVQEHALGALWNVARVEDLLPNIHSAASAAASTGAAASITAQGYKMIVQCLRSDSRDVQYEACGLLQWLAKGPAPCKKAIPEAGAIKPLVAILAAASDCGNISSSSSNDRENDEMELKGNAAGVLRHLADGCLTNQINIAAAGAIPHLVQMLGSSDSSNSSLETMQREAAGALRAIAHSTQTSNRDSITRAGGIQQLVQLLSSSTSSAVQSEAAAALTEVVRGRPGHKTAAAEAGAVEVLKALAGSRDKVVASAAKSAVAILA